MKRLIPSVAVLATALLALLLCAGAVQSGELTTRSELALVPGAADPQHVPRVVGDQAAVSPVLSTPEYSLTRIVTITVGTSTAPLTPGLSSRWQVDSISQQFLNGRFDLPADASAITVTVINGAYGIDYSGPTIYITGSQGVYYEYRTDQQVPRFGNEFLISQSYSFNRPFRYVGTVTFTDPYQFVGYTGYAPTQTSATELHWDQPFTQSTRQRFDTATWLVDPNPLSPKPELEIIAATAYSQFNHFYVAATIRNNGGIVSAGAPVFINLYDRLSPSPPANALDLTDGWCTVTPVPRCGGSNNPLPSIEKNQTVVFTAESDLTPVDGQHFIYLFVDALGITGTVQNVGMNLESGESNNWFLAGMVMRLGKSVFLPLIKL